MIFRLSNTQKKQLLIRGGPLQIAIPTPEFDPENGWLPWARRAFIEDGKYITGVLIDHVTVTPTGDRGLAGLMGAIVHDPASADESLLMWRIEVALLNFDPPNKPRQPRQRVQWPASAEHDGVRYPESDTQYSEPSGTTNANH